MKAKLAPFLWRYSLLKRYLHLFLLLKNWKARVLAERGKKTETNHLILRNGLKFQTEGSIKITNDVFLEIFQSKSYLKFIASPPKTLVDVGGHFGFFSCQVAQKYPTCKIFTFEPAPQTFNVLKQNIVLNKLKNVTPHNQAVGSQEGTISFFESDHHESSSLFNLTGSAQQVEVSITTLENLMTNNDIGIIDILKLDCEGAEFDIVQNSIATLAGFVKCIICEYHTGLRKDKEVERDLVIPIKSANFQVDTYEINADLGYLIAYHKPLDA